MATLLTTAHTIAIDVRVACRPTLLSLEGNVDYGPIKRPSHKSDLDAPDLKQRHDSFFPPTPALSPLDDGEELTEMSSGN